MLVLLLGGWGWGRQVSGEGVTLPMLLLTLAFTGVGLALCIQGAMRGNDLPLALGAVGAVALGTFTTFGRKN